MMWCSVDVLDHAGKVSARLVKACESDADAMRVAAHALPPGGTAEVWIDKRCLGQVSRLMKDA